MNIVVKKFSELCVYQLYELLQLRAEVFVVEQRCIYQDIDNKDIEAWHVVGTKDEKIVAYTRICRPNKRFNNPSIGRVIVDKNYRKRQYGYSIMEYSIRFIEEELKWNTIDISAQKYLLKFYINLGFYPQGEEYLEDNIPHIHMIWKTKAKRVF